MAGISRGKRAALLASVFFICVTSAVSGVSAFLDGSWVFPVGLAFHPGVEFSIRSFDLQSDMVLTLGAAVTGQVAFAKMWNPWSYTTFGLAIAPLALLSFDDGTQEVNRFIERLEFSLSPGIGFNFYIYSGDPAYYANQDEDNFVIGFAGIAGCRIRISRYLSLRLDATYWGRYIRQNIALGLQLDLW
jgi:hypothetical protein